MQSSAVRTPAPMSASKTGAMGASRRSSADLALGAAQMGADDDGGAMGTQVLDRGNGATDAGVVGDTGAVGVGDQGDVEIGTEQNALAGQVQIADGSFADDSLSDRPLRSLGAAFWGGFGRCGLGWGAGLGLRHDLRFRQATLRPLLEEWIGG